MVDTTSHHTSDHSAAFTPAERRRQRVRDAILTAAERLFAQEGPEALSIRRLADEIDYSPAAIYKYFESKDALLHVLKEGFFARLVEHIDDVLNDPSSFEVRAHKCLQRYVLTALERPQHYVAAFSGGASENDPHEIEPDTMRMQAFEFLAAMMREGQAEGALRTDIDAESMAKSAWLSLHGAAMMMAHLPDFPDGMPSSEPMSREDFVTLHAETIYRGLKA